MDGGLGALPEEEEEYGRFHGITGHFAREIAWELVREIARDSGRKTWYDWRLRSTFPGYFLPGFFK